MKMPNFVGSVKGTGRYTCVPYTIEIYAEYNMVIVDNVRFGLNAAIHMASTVLQWLSKSNNNEEIQNSERNLIGEVDNKQYAVPYLFNICFQQNNIILDNSKLYLNQALELSSLLLQAILLAKTH